MDQPLCAGIAEKFHFGGISGKTLHLRKSGFWNCPREFPDPHDAFAAPLARSDKFCHGYGPPKKSNGLTKGNFGGERRDAAFFAYNCDRSGHIQNGKPARCKNPGKMGKKMENGSRAEMAKKRPPKWKNGQKVHLESIFPFRRPFFGHFGPGAIFHWAGFPFCIGPLRSQAYNWKLPADSGAFSLTLTVLALLLTIGACLLTV